MSAVGGHGASRKGGVLSSGSLESRQLWEQPPKARLLAASISLPTWSPHSEAETTYSVKQILVLPGGCQMCLLSLWPAFCLLATVNIIALLGS